MISSASTHLPQGLHSYLTLKWLVTHKLPNQVNVPFSHRYALHTALPTLQNQYQFEHYNYYSVSAGTCPIFPNMTINAANIKIFHPAPLYILYDSEWKLCLSLRILYKTFTVSAGTANYRQPSPLGHANISVSSYRLLRDEYQINRFVVIISLHRLRRDNL